MRGSLHQSIYSAKTYKDITFCVFAFNKIGVSAPVKPVEKSFLYNQINKKRYNIVTLTLVRVPYAYGCVFNLAVPF